MTLTFGLPHRIGRASLVAATLLLTAALTGAQQPGAGQTPAASTAQTASPPLPPAVFHDLIPTAELGFLADYDGKMPKELERDKRFRQLEKLITPSTYYFYHYDRELSEVRDLVLDE